MEVLRNCESPIEMNSFDADMNSTSSPENQAMLPNRGNDKSLQNNNHIRREGMLKIINFDRSTSFVYSSLLLPVHETLIALMYSSGRTGSVVRSNL